MPLHTSRFDCFCLEQQLPSRLASSHWINVPFSGHDFCGLGWSAVETLVFSCKLSRNNAMCRSYEPTCSAIPAFSRGGRDPSGLRTRLISFTPSACKCQIDLDRLDRSAF